MVRGGPEVCKKVADKIECNAEAAMIQDALRECTNACPTRQEWAAYCSNGRFNCEADCELLTAEGKSASEVKSCKEACAKKGAECEASYRDKLQCETDCTKAYQKNMDEFDKRWFKRLTR